MIRVAHFADVHLSRKQFQRTTRTGVNIRESDVALAFRRTVDAIIDAKPDLILCAGDLFHSLAPGNLARLEAAKQFKRLASVAPVMVVAGNHSTPRSVESGCPVALLGEIPGVTVATQDVGRWVDPAGRFGVCLMPHAALVHGQLPVFPGTPLDILLVHGATPGLHRDEWGPSMTAAPFDPAGAGSWAYVALGDYHVTRQVAPNAWYPGSLEYVSSNPWGELEEEQGRGKSWLLVELGADGEVAEAGNAGDSIRACPLRVSVQPVATRRHVDLPAIDGTGLTVAELLSRVSEQTDAVQPWEGVICRQIVTGLDRSTRRALSVTELVRDLGVRALQFRLDVRLATSRIGGFVDGRFVVTEPREPWEEEQDRASAYWDGREPSDEGVLPALPSQFDPGLDPYHLNEPEPVRHVA